MKKTPSEAAGIRIENDQELIVTAYTDNIIIMAKNEDDLKKAAHGLIEKRKTKYLIITRYIQDKTLGNR